MGKELAEIYDDRIFLPVAQDPGSASPSGLWLEGLLARGVGDPVRSSLYLHSVARSEAEMARDPVLGPRRSLDHALNATTALLRAGNPTAARECLDELRRLWAWREITSEEQAWYLTTVEELGAEVEARLAEFHALVAQAQAEMRKGNDLSSLSDATLARLIDSFPGTAPLHWAAYLAAARSMEWTAAQSRLRVARLLSPDNPAYVSAEMLLIPRCNPPEVALSRCRWLYREWGGRSGRVAHAYAVALLRLRPIFPDVFEEAYEASSRAFRLLPRDLSSQGIILVGLLRDYCAWKLKTPGFSKPDPIRLGDEDSFVLILPDPEMKEFETSLLELSEAA